MEVRDPKKQNLVEGSRTEEPPLKRHRSGKNSGAATRNATIVYHKYAKIGHQNASKADVHTRCNVDVDEIIDATSKGLELFMRHASHSRKQKNMSKENKNLKFKLSQADSDRK